MPDSPDPNTAATAAEPAPPAPAAEKPLSPLLQALKKPIPGANPCGEEIGGGDEAFQKIKDEINKIDAVDLRPDYKGATQTAAALTTEEGRKKAKSGQTVSTEGDADARPTSRVDYALIIESATKILTEKSKDLRVAIYLCLALWKTQRFAGLAEGLATINIVLQDFGEGWFPPKTRAAARKGIIEFWTKKLSDDLAEAAVAAEDGEPLKSAVATLNALQKIFVAQMPQWETTLLGLAVAVEKCAGKVPKTEGGGKPVNGGEDPPPPPPPPGEVKSDETAIEFIRKAAGYWRGQNRKNAAPYRLVRSMRWDKLSNDPPNDNGKTQIEAPPAQRREYFIKLQQSGQWDKLLDEGEGNVAQPPFHLWLDLQRLIVAAMEGLGGDYYPAKMAILQELAFLLQRAPKLPSLTFKDGTRFADAATQSWIEETVMPVLGSGETAAAAPSMVDLESHMASLFEEAKKLMTRGDLAAAIAHLEEGKTLDTSSKNRFRRRLFMATLCLRGGQPKMARSLLEELNAEVEKFSLTEWDPPLALEVWTNQKQCYEALMASAPAAGKTALQELADRTFEKMCRVDLSYALATQGTKPKTKRPVLPKAAKPKLPLLDETEITEPAIAAGGAEGNGKVESEAEANSDGKK